MRENENVVLEGVRIIFRNFSGEETKFNREGNRNFVVVLPEDIGRELAEKGWNVKFREPREEGDPIEAQLQVTVGFRGRPPKILLISGGRRRDLDEDTVSMLDWADIVNVDMVLRPYDWEVNGKTGRKAYLKSLYVTVEEDELEEKYAEN